MGLTDGIVEWFNYSTNEIVYNKFSHQEWKYIFQDIDSDRGFDFFISDNLIKCYILKKCNENKTQGFVFLLSEQHSKKVFSIHGGGWGHNPYLYYRGYILMIEHLLTQGIKVITFCDMNNIRALRFNKGIGFILYKNTNNRYYLCINLKRLKNSKIYKYFY